MILLNTVLLISLVSPVKSDPISISIEKYKNIYSYEVTLVSKGGNTKEIIRYYYKKPGFIRMEFEKPYNGAVLVYNPLKERVRLSPFGFLRRFVLNLKPDNMLIKSSKGHRVDESDIGSLLKMVKRLQTNGVIEVIDTYDIAGRRSNKVTITGDGNFTVNSIHRYVLWIDVKTYMPIRVLAYNIHSELIEEVQMYDLKVNVEFNKDLFEL